MRRATKITGISLIAIFSLLALLVLGLYTVLSTQAGSRWVRGWVPGLQLDNVNGQLAGEWRADQLRWAQGNNRVEVDVRVVA
uniref:hypothetical protein n=1 Tax=Pseudomonas sp. TaxID=306 RepID=UPI0026044EEC